MKQDDGLRSWLKQADDLGELRTIDGADWDLEMLSGSRQFARLDQAARLELGNATKPKRAGIRLGVAQEIQGS